MEKKLKNKYMENKKAVIITLVSIIGVIITIILHLCKIIIPAYIFAFITQFVFCTIFLIVMIPISTDIIYERKYRIGMGFVINIIFILSAILFTPESILLGKFGLLISFVFYFLVLLLIYKFVKISNNHDLSALSVTNSIISFFFSLVVYFLKYNILGNSLDINEKGFQFLEFYFLIPNTLLLGLYGFLGMKARAFVNSSGK